VDDLRNNDIVLWNCKNANNLLRTWQNLSWNTQHLV